MSMSKTDFVKAIARDTDLTQVAVNRVLDSISSIASQELRANSEVTVPGIGKLKLSHRPARTGRRPTDGAEIEIAAKNVVKMTIAKSLKDSVQ